MGSLYLQVARRSSISDGGLEVAKTRSQRSMSDCRELGFDGKCGRAHTKQETSLSWSMYVYRSAMSYVILLWLGFRAFSSFS